MLLAGVSVTLSRLERFFLASSKKDGRVHQQAANDRCAPTARHLQGPVPPPPRDW